MGFKKIAVASLILFGIVSCSKPAQDGSSSNDSTAQTEPESPDSRPQQLALSPSDLERINLEIFLWLHDYQTYGYDPGLIAYKESYTSRGNSFRYQILRHNGDRTGQYTTYSQESQNYGEPTMEPAIPISAETQKANTERDAKMAKSDPEPAEEEYEEYDPHAYDDVYWTNEGFAVGEIDTVNAEAVYAAYPEGDPEQRRIRIVFIGNIKWTNYNYIKYGVQKSGERAYDIPDMVIDLSTPRVLSRDQLYLKAKITSLTDKDLAGMNKDDLIFLRNEIFARHGHSFKTDKMKQHFQPLEWYRPVIADAAVLLNDFEKQNVEFIKKKEG